MDISFYEVIIPKLRALANSIKEPGYMKYLEKVRNSWTPLVNKTPKPPAIVYGIDGGSRGVDFKGFTIGLATAISVGYVFEGNVYKVLEPMKTAFVGKIIPPLDISERVNLYREILEGKIAVHSCKNNALVLMDGSISSILVRPRPGPRAKGRYMIIDDVINSIKNNDNEYFKKLATCIDKTLSSISDLNEAPICSSLMQPSGLDKELYDVASVVIEYLEKLYVYGRLLERVINGSCKLIFIAKTSHSREIFESNYPDIFIFEKLTKTPGRSIEVLKRLAEYKDLPISILDEEFAKPLEMFLVTGSLYSYMRLEENGPVLKVEIIGDYMGLQHNEASLLDEIYSMLLAVSNNGYPHPLRIAHIDSHITYSDVEKILRLLGLDIEVTGREVLE